MLCSPLRLYSIRQQISSRIARGEALAEWRAQPVTSIRQHTAEAHNQLRSHDRPPPSAISRSVRAVRIRPERPTLQPLAIISSSSREGKGVRLPSPGTSPCASVSDTSVWQGTKRTCPARRSGTCRLGRCELHCNDPCSLTPLIELICPDLHHVATFGPVFGRVRVRAANVVRLLVGQLPLDGVGIPAAHFIQPNGVGGAKSVGSCLVLAVAEATQRGIESVLRDRARRAAHRWK
jgi:hypothetical protein